MKIKDFKCPSCGNDDFYPFVSKKEIIRGYTVPIVVSG